MRRALKQQGKVKMVPKCGVCKAWPGDQPHCCSCQKLATRLYKAQAGLLLVPALRGLLECFDGRPMRNTYRNEKIQAARAALDAIKPTPHTER